MDVTSTGKTPKEKLNFEWDVLAKTPGLEKFGPDSEVKAVDGGTINYVFRMTSDKDLNLTVIIKHGGDHVKEFPVFPLPGERTTMEFWGMKKMSELVPGSAPTPFLYNADQNYIIMEDLGSYTLLRDKLQQGSLDLFVMERLASYIAKLHRFSHQSVMKASEHEKLVEMCKPTGMRELGVRHVFIDPVERKGGGQEGQYADEVEKFMEDKSLFPNFLKLKEADQTRSDCLVHGDFHTSSVMVKGSSVKIFDFEFAHMGPAGNDVGHILANFIKAYLDHKHYPLNEGSTFHQHLEKATFALVDSYFQEAKEYLSEEDFARTVSETAGYTACRLLRRMWGLREIGDDVNEPLTDKGMLHIAYRLLRNFEKIRTTDELKEYLLNEDE